MKIRKQQEIFQMEINIEENALAHDKSLKNITHRST